MSVNSGIQFPIPRLPKSHSLRKVTSAGNVANAISHRQIPSYPPLRIEQILRLIENGSSDAITVLEWLNVFRCELFFENDEEGYRAASLIWRAISENERLSRIALYLAGLQINGQNDKFPKLLIDSMSVAKPLLKGIHSRRVSWLIALQAEEYTSCVNMAVELKCVPTDVPKSLNLPQVTKCRRDLQNALLSLVTVDLGAETRTWFERAFSMSTRLEMIEIVDTLLGKEKSVFSQFLNWLTDICHPESVDTIWFEVSEKSRQKLKSEFKLGSFFVFQSFVGVLIESAPEKLEEHEKKTLRNRVSFWSNYSEKIGQMKFIIPANWHLELELKSRFAELDYILSHDNERDGDNPVCLFELEKVIAIVVLTGRASEIRLFENNSRNRNRFFNNNTLTLTQIRKLACLQIHDHVTLWQFFFEQVLRKQLDIYPNEGIEYFNGMKKEYGHYDSVKGLNRPSKELIKQRGAYLDNWLAAFRDREKALNLNDESSAFVQLQFAKLCKLKGDTKGFRKLLRDAINQGSIEAKYILALDILSYSSSTKSEKVEAEGMLRDSASLGYVPAQKLCKQFYLTYQKASRDPRKKKAVQPAKENLGTEDESAQSAGTLAEIKDKVRLSDKRPYLSLKIDELEIVAGDASLNYFDKLIIANELEGRRQTPRVKALIEYLNVK